MTIPLFQDSIFFCSKRSGSLFNYFLSLFLNSYLILFIPMEKVIVVIKPKENQAEVTRFFKEFICAWLANLS